jgi:hypothetical protein
MIHFTYLQKSGGASGHMLGEICTTFVMASLMGGEAVYHDSWIKGSGSHSPHEFHKDFYYPNKQLIISEGAFKENTTPLLEKYDYIHDIKGFALWESASYDQYEKTKNEILELAAKYNNLLVRITDTYLIRFHVVYEWFRLKHLKEDLYSSHLIPKLRQLYYYDHEKLPLKNALAIQVRTGPLWNSQLKNAGFTCDYYTEIIEIFNKYFDIDINIYCENVNHNDVLKLNELKNTTVKAGGFGELTTHFNEMCRSRFFFVSECSLSLFVGYLSQGTHVLVDAKIKKNRPNLWNHTDNLPNFVPFSNFEEGVKALK